MKELKRMSGYSIIGTHGTLNDIHTPLYHRLYRIIECEHHQKCYPPRPLKILGGLTSPLSISWPIPLVFQAAPEAVATARCLMDWAACHHPRCLK